MTKPTRELAGSKRNNDAIDDLIEKRPRSIFRLSLLGICFAVMLMDGFHQLTMAVVGGAVSHDLALSSTNLGFLMSASELGVMLGAFALSPVTDRLGRQRMLLLSTLAFGVFSIATAFAQTLPALLVLRMLTGIGLGAAGPAIVSLATEYSPVHHRAHVATLIWAANPAGAALSGILSGMIVPHHGWRELFLMAGGVTMALGVLVALFVPESVRFLLLRAPKDPRVARILRTLGANDAQAIVDDPKFRAQAGEKGVPVGILFNDGNANFTIALWAAFFLCFMCLLATITWTVGTLARAGIGIEISGVVVTFNTIGGTIGVASAGWIMERLGARSLVVTFVIGVLAIVGMGQVMHNTPLLCMLSTLTGFCIGGNTSGLIVLAIDRYPIAIRATGFGWGMSVGRLGGTLSPVLMGVVAGVVTPPAALFAAMAVPGALAAIVTLLLCKQGRPPGVRDPVAFAA